MPVTSRNVVPPLRQGDQILGIPSLLGLRTAILNDGLEVIEVRRDCPRVPCHWHHARDIAAPVRGQHRVVVCQARPTTTAGERVHHDDHTTTTRAALIVAVANLLSTFDDEGGEGGDEDVEEDAYCLVMAVVCIYFIKYSIHSKL